MTIPLVLASAEAVAGGDRERQIITTEGHGEVRVRPDSVRTNFGVEVQAETLDEARSQVNKTMRDVISALNRLRIPGLVLQTDVLQVYPVRKPERTGELPKIVGYRAVNSLTASIAGAAPDELGEISGRILDAALKAGANTVARIDFFLRNASDAEDKALEAAVADAERNARTMAKAAGVEFGGLYSLEGTRSFQGEMSMRAFEAPAVPSTPVVAGEIVISSRVSARFTFVQK